MSAFVIMKIPIWWLTVYLTYKEVISHSHIKVNFKILVSDLKNKIMPIYFENNHTYPGNG